MSALIDKLTDYGCKVNEAMGRFLNNEDFYGKCFTKYVNDESFEEFGEAIKAGDVKAAFGAAHDLKGISANMGITPVYDLVISIVEEFRAGRMPDHALTTWEEIMAVREKLKKIIE